MIREFSRKKTAQFRLDHAPKMRTRRVRCVPMPRWHSTAQSLDLHIRDDRVVTSEYDVKIT